MSNSYIQESENVWIILNWLGGDRLQFLADLVSQLMQS